jgi:group I intron endonuclease
MAVVYGIRNKLNGFVYVGCTAGKLAKRMREHRSLLNGWKHTATQLQTDWHKHGESAFEIVTLEMLPEGASVVTKRVRELYWMQHFSTALYNAHQTSFAPTKEAIAKGVEASRTVIGNRWTKEANEKRRMAQLGKPKGHGAKISATKRARRALQSAYEIVCSAQECAGALDKEPGT